MHLRSLPVANSVSTAVDESKLEESPKKRNVLTCKYQTSFLFSSRQITLLYYTARQTIVARGRGSKRAGATTIPGADAANERYEQPGGSYGASAPREPSFRVPARKSALDPRDQSSQDEGAAVRRSRSQASGRRGSTYARRSRSA